MIKGDQQVAVESFVATDLYAPILNANEARLLPAIAAAEDCSVYTTVTDTYESSFPVWKQGE
jgi:hypothetical protein